METFDCVHCIQSELRFAQIHLNVQLLFAVKSVNLMNRNDAHIEREKGMRTSCRQEDKRFLHL